MTLNPNRLEEIIRRHFEEVTNEQFRERLQRCCSDSLPPDIERYFQRAEEVARERQRSEEQAIQSRPLAAYFASALTGLDRDERNRVNSISKVAVEVCEQHSTILYGKRSGTPRSADRKSEHIYPYLVTDRGGSW